MTCIVGLAYKGKVIIGGDSCGTSDYNLVIRADEKVFKNGNTILGFCQSFRFGQILRYSFEFPLKSEPCSDMQYLVKDVIPALRERLKSEGFSKVSDNQEEGGHCLLGFNKNLYCIESDFQVGQPSCRYHAIGSGAAYALGSMHSTRNSKLSPKNRILKALEAASAHNMAVRPPFVVLGV